MGKTHKTSMPTEVTIDDCLSLRRLVPGDAEALFRIIRDDPEIRRNVTWPAGVHSLDDARRTIERLLKEDKTPYTLRENGITIGFAGTWGVEGNNHEIGFSYFLAKDKRGHGYATRAIQKLMQTVKGNLPIDTFVVNITDANKPSQAIAAKLSFEATDVLIKDKALPSPIRRYERAA